MGPVATELLDSSILIDHFNGIAAATEFIDECDSPAISVITWIEVVTGFRSASDEAAGRQLLAALAVLPVSDPVSEEAVVIRRTSRLKLPDAIILATARAHGLVLVTRNTKDFPAGDPSIRVPYEL